MTLLLGVVVVLLLALLVGAVALAAGIAFLLARATTRPLEELGDAAARVAAGDLSTAIEVRSRDEVGRLALTFNAMTDDLRSYVGALQTSRDELQVSRDELQAGVARLGATLASTHDLDGILTVVLDAAMASTRAGAGAVLLLSADRSALELAVGKGLPDDGPRRLALGEGVAGPLNERQKDYAGHISRSSGSLLVIINDILDLASIDNGTVALDLGDVDLAETIDAAVKGLSDRFTSSKIGLDIRIKPGIGQLRADGKRLRQVMFNLLSNAVGFSQGGQTVTIRAERKGQDVVIEVADQGQGIPADVIDKVFDRFESHAKGANHRGVGLGLSIVRSFIELHGGRVEIASEPGKGTCVTCHLPSGGRALTQAAE